MAFRGFVDEAKRAEGSAHPWVGAIEAVRAGSWPRCVRYAIYTSRRSLTPRLVDTNHLLGILASPAVVAIPSDPFSLATLPLHPHRAPPHTRPRPRCSPMLWPPNPPPCHSLEHPLGRMVFSRARPAVASSLLLPPPSRWSRM